MLVGQRMAQEGQPQGVLWRALEVTQQRDRLMRVWLDKYMREWLSDGIIPVFSTGEAVRVKSCVGGEEKEG